MPAVMFAENVSGAIRNPGTVEQAFWEMVSRWGIEVVGFREEGEYLIVDAVVADEYMLQVEQEAAAAPLYPAVSMWYDAQAPVAPAPTSASPAASTPSLDPEVLRVINTMKYPSSSIQPVVPPTAPSGIPPIDPALLIADTSVPVEGGIPPYEARPRFPLWLLLAVGAGFLYFFWWRRRDRKPHAQSLQPSPGHPDRGEG